MALGAMSVQEPIAVQESVVMVNDPLLDEQPPDGQQEYPSALHAVLSASPRPVMMIPLPSTAVKMAAIASSSFFTRSKSFWELTCVFALFFALHAKMLLTSLPLLFGSASMVTKKSAHVPTTSSQKTSDAGLLMSKLLSTSPGVSRQPTTIEGRTGVSVGGGTDAFNDLREANTESSVGSQASAIAILAKTRAPIIDALILNMVAIVCLFVCLCRCR
mmetsp:Transcript_9607/g.26134  ORF Transcript_9607/g.26134 Transcript_9607/m.26134 type:complete len:217 (+) Transcript_9607:2-652(+)